MTDSIKLTHTVPKSDGVYASDPVLRVVDLHVHFHTRSGPIRAVNGVTFSLRRGQRLGLVGESGSGKTTTALAMLHMIKPPGRIEGGEILLGGTDILRLSKEEVRQTRSAVISMIPQGAMSTLNPVRRIGDQIRDGFRDHGVLRSQVQYQEMISGLLSSVGLDPEVRSRFPHELSGGMKQRVTIAMAILLTPKVIVADEPTSALDVVVQRQIIETLGREQEKIGAAVVLIGHDMGLMAQFVDLVGVMYAGRVVELGPVEQVFEKPLHPYTQLLISSLPDTRGKKPLRGIPGITPSLLDPPPGCPFHPRCPKFMEDRCEVAVPEFSEVYPERYTSCFLHSEAEA